ncbi:MAG: helix-turn-helix domain-containing protein [Deltaproteobacteria bacterium]|nr:helix-turn-helix domain-containing protein [Deltaproteobacteria bacterium]
MDRRYLSTREAAEVLRTTPGNLANMRMRGEGPAFIKQKRKCLYDIRDIENWLDHRRIRSADD